MEFPWLDLTLVADRSLAMTSRLAGGATADTVVARWEVASHLQLRTGDTSAAAVVGTGRRSFEITTAASLRSPAGHYGYLVLGAEAARAGARRLVLRASAALEPVLGGAEPTAMTLGPARRWGLDVAGGVDVQALPGVHVSLTIDYQRFAWSWPDAGIRGEGGAVDEYPAAYAAVAASY